MAANGATPMPFDQVAFRPRGEGGDMASLAMLTGAEQGTELGTGFGRLKNAHLTWTLAYDEVLLVIEGRLRVGTPDGTHDLGPKDSIWLPKGTALTYEAEDALIFFAVHPASAVST
ncbi:MAG: ethanolamine utilization protein EutQ [Pseudomonadota bacterium]